MDITKRILSLDSLPSLGIETQYFLKCIQDPNVEFSEVIQTIEKNIALSAHFLKIANSVKYAGKYGSIGSISQAVSRIGLKEVSKISLAISMIQNSPTSKNMDIKEFWKHSVSVALITRLIIEGSKEKKINPDSAYIAGLFHDIGILILSSLEPEKYQELIEKSESQSIDISILEKDFFGIDHGSAGRVLLQEWKLPEALLCAVEFHHFPDKSAHQELGLTQAVHVADFYASLFGFLMPSKKMPENCSQGALHDLNLSSEVLEELVEKVKREISNADFFI